MANIHGQMDVALKVNGSITRCMVLEFSHGQMAGYIRVIMKMIRNAVMESLYGLMARSMMGNGMMENSMDMVIIHQHQVRRKRQEGANGRTVNVSDGQTKIYVKFYQF